MFHLGFFISLVCTEIYKTLTPANPAATKTEKGNWNILPNSLPCEMIRQHNERGTPDILFCLNASFAHVADETFQIAGLRSNSHFFKEGVISVGWILC